MARDRQRAKQRRARRADHPAQPSQDGPPSPLDHASGEVDEAEAAIAAGAAEAQASARDAFGRDDEPDAGFGDGEPDEDALEREAVAAAPAQRDSLEGQASVGAPTRRGPARFIGFLRACWAELQRVQWPDRVQVVQATAVVLGFVVVAGAYLGVADWVAQRIVNFVI